mmetsp:Transcript_17636/g.31890  ORF Transcript_17636/g.31890 Transcript_17636/m.31890 type:complete len:150 (-) Transcript_17636:182-631(-)
MRRITREWHSQKSIGALLTHHKYTRHNIVYCLQLLFDLPCSRRVSLSSYSVHPREDDSQGSNFEDVLHADFEFEYSLCSYHRQAPNMAENLTTCPTRYYPSCQEPLQTGSLRNSYSLAFGSSFNLITLLPSTSSLSLSSDCVSSLKQKE